jgi:hypothetical protein
MNSNLAKEIDAAQTLNEIWAAFNKYYELNEPLPLFTGGLAKQKIKNNLDAIIEALNVKPKGAQVATRRKLF